MKRDPGANANAFFVLNNERISFNDWSLSPQYLLLTMMFILLFLHVFWFFMIVRMAYGFLTDTLHKDIRSDEEEAEVSYDTVQKNSNNKKNVKKNNNNNNNNSNQKNTKKNQKKKNN